MDNAVLLGKALENFVEEAGAVVGRSGSDAVAVVPFHAVHAHSLEHKRLEVSVDEAYDYVGRFLGGGYDGGAFNVETRHERSLGVDS